MVLLLLGLGITTLQSPTVVMATARAPLVESRFHGRMVKLFGPQANFFMKYIVGGGEYPTLSGLGYSLNDDSNEHAYHYNPQPGRIGRALIKIRLKKATQPRDTSEAEALTALKRARALWWTRFSVFTVIGAYTSGTLTCKVIRRDYNEYLCIKTFTQLESERAQTADTAPLDLTTGDPPMTDPATGQLSPIAEERLGEDESGIFRERSPGPRLVGN